jgi:hypothetical protein
MRRVLLLIAGSLALWLVVALPARMLGGGDAAIIFSGTALLLCLVPAVGTLIWATWSLRKHSEQQLMMILGGTGLRMFFVLGVGLLISLAVPYYQEQTGFWIWLLVFYLITLALEMGLMLTIRPTKA